jgi:hypothetical protein
MWLEHLAATDLPMLQREADFLMCLVARSGRQAEAALQVLLRAGANVNVTFPDGRTALHLVAQSCPRPEAAIALLLAAGANPNARTPTQWTPLHLVARYRPEPEACLRLLLEAGAKPNASTDHGQTLKNLVRRIANIPKGWTALQLVGRYCPRPQKAIRLLTEHGAVVTQELPEGSYSEAARQCLALPGGARR